MQNEREDLKNKFGRFSEALGQIIDEYHNTMENSRNEIQEIHEEYGLDLIKNDIGTLERLMQEATPEPVVRDSNHSTSSSSNSKVGVKAIDVKVVPKKAVGVRFEFGKLD